jgi:hypothetical protein
MVNLTLLIFFAFYRRRIALGALALVGSLLVWVVLSGVFFFVGCFVFFLGGSVLGMFVIGFLGYLFGGLGAVP